jgi:hypothetical protein
LRPPLFRELLLRLDFLPELLRAPAFLRPPLFAAAMLSLHDEVELSPVPWLELASPASRPDRHASRNKTDCDDELHRCLKTRREYRMQEMCVQYCLPSISPDAIITSKSSSPLAG